MTASIALRNLFRHRLRSLVTLFAVGVGAITIVFISGYFEDTYFKMRESYIHSHTGHIQIRRRGVEAERSTLKERLIAEAASVRSAVMGIEGIAAVTPRLHFGSILTSGQNSVSAYGQGLDPAGARHLPKESTENRLKGSEFPAGILISGRDLTTDDAFGVMLGNGLAERLGVSVGDPVVIMAGTVHGSLNARDVTVAGTFATSAKAFDDNFFRLPLSAAQELIRTDGVESLFVFLKKTEDTDAVAEKIGRIVQDRAWDVEVRTWKELNDFYFRTRALFGSIFLVLKFVLGLIIILSVYNTIMMSVNERVSEISTLRAIGTTRGGIAALFLWEGAFMGFFGGLAGAITGMILTGVTGMIGIPMPPPPGAPLGWTSEPVVVPSAAAFAILFSVVVAVLSAILPARRAAGLDVADGLRHVG